MNTLRIALTLITAVFLSPFLNARHQPATPNNSSALPSDEPAQDFSKEPYIYKFLHTTMRYENDGNGVRETRARIVLQTQAGLSHVGQLIFPYNSENETVDIRSIRVIKPDGAVIVTGPENIQDLSAAVAQIAPVYSDARQKHVTVAGLSVGDTVEYDAVVSSKPLAPGQFWQSFVFHFQAICLDEQLELNVPLNRQLKIKGPDDVTPEIREESDRRVSLWKTANLAVPKPTEFLTNFKIDVQKMLRGPRPTLPRRVAFSTFQSWAEAGNWYAGLERGRREPTPAVRAQADEIVQGKLTEPEKAQALYEWVTRNIRYVSLSFGVGRYQPHPAADVLANRYGDCKDKTTLLEAFFAAEGIRAKSALVNGFLDVDPEVPTMLAFDHVIALATIAGKELWLDPTVNVVPYGYLFPQLRGQNALVTADDQTSAIRQTPKDLPINVLYQLDITGEINNDGNLDATAKFVTRGDLEVLLRLFNSTLPPAQFTSFVQEAMTKGNKSTYGESRFTDFRLENASDISKPLRGQFHFVGRLIHIKLDETSPGKLVDGVYSALLAKSDQIPWPFASATLAESSLEEPGGPKEYALAVAVTAPNVKLSGSEKPFAKHLESDSGDFDAHATWDKQTWRADWHLTIRRVTFHVPQRDDSDFRDEVLATLKEARSTTEAAKTPPQIVTTTKSATPPPPSASAPVAAPESPARDLYQAARRAGSNREYAMCAQLLEQAVSKDPNYNAAWAYLGWTYNTLGKYEKAETALRKAVALNPSDSASYNNLGQALAGQKKYEEAIPQYQKQIELNSRDQWAHANLGRVYVLTKQYEKAIPELETAAFIKPDDPYIPFNLGRAYAKTGQPEKAVQFFTRSVDLQPVPARWNWVAYEMALDNLQLDQAQKYAESAIAATVLQTRSTSLDHLTNDDVRLTSALASYWDTLGWIKFQQGKLPEAEKYVRSAWLLHSNGEVTDHLAQIYEKQGRKTEAIRFYAMALATAQPMPEARGRLAALLGSDVTIDSLTEQAKPQLKEARTVQVKNSRSLDGIAEFWILLSPGPKVHAVKFIAGDDDLAQLADDIQSTDFPDCFAEATELLLVRRARLSCLSNAPNCSLFLNSAESVQAPEPSGSNTPADTSPSRVRLGGNVATQKIKSKVEPVYPPLARSTGIEGVVKLHAIIAKDGSILQLQVESGHPLLVQAALDAVRQWKYEPTTLNGQAVEVDTEIDVIFQLSKKQPTQ